MPEHHWAIGSKERMVLALLGIGGITPLAKLAGVNHETAGAILGTLHRRWKARPASIARVHQTLHAAYNERRAELSKAERKLLIDWQARWKNSVMRERLAYTSEGRIKDPSPSEQRRTQRKHERLREAMRATLDALVWS